MSENNLSYGRCVANSEQVAWKVHDVFPEGASLDFTRPFMPAGYAPSIDAILDADQKRILNQILGHSYLNLFLVVEEFIIAMTIQHQSAELFGDHDALRALARFTDEELKHQQLFSRYREAFRGGFGHDCNVVENATEIAAAILSRSPIAVVLLTLHLELITQYHYTEAIRDDNSIDPLFQSLLKHHWLEESQHARIDQLELQKLVAVASEQGIRQAFDEYVELLGELDSILERQAKMDIASLGHAISKSFTSEQVAEMQKSQWQAYRTLFIVAGLKHAHMVRTVEDFPGIDASELTAHRQRFEAA